MVLSVLLASMLRAQPATQPVAPDQQLLRELSPIMREIDEMAHMGRINEAINSGDAKQWIDKTNHAIDLVRRLHSLDAAKFATFAPLVERRFVAVLAALEDPATTKRLADESNADNAATLLHARWLRTPFGDAKREALLEEFQQAAQSTSDANESLALALREVQFGRLSAEERARVQQIITTDLSETSVARDLNERKRGEERFAALEGQALTLAGRALDGSEFSTEQWKGKVVLVDFWATWCGPCLQELPRVKEAYAKFHDQGLEVLGVSCDQSADDLKKFLEANPDMPWPQLFDPAKPGWHALAKEYGVQGIPTMFLIDKKGIVRSVRAREDFEQEIPKLLEE